MRFADWGDDPAKWVTRHGAPAACLGDPTKPNTTGGMASYEADDGRVVYDLQRVRLQLGDMATISRWYDSVCVITQEGFVPLHHSPEAEWCWRPCIYRRSIHGFWLRMGSQWELEHRERAARTDAAFGLLDLPGVPPEGATDYEFLGALDAAMVWAAAVMARLEATDMQKADEKAEELLGEHLNPLQWLEWKAGNNFHVRGAATGNTYEVRVGDGFLLVDPVTHETMASYCLHPEHWIPDADVALSIKLGLEDPTMEPELLEAAKGRTMGLGSKHEHRTKELRYAADAERALL